MRHPIIALGLFLAPFGLTACHRDIIVGTCTEDSGCTVCSLTSCAAEGVACGQIPDNCGGMLDCGPCGDGGADAGAALDACTTCEADSGAQPADSGAQPDAGVTTGQDAGTVDGGICSGGFQDAGNEGCDCLISALPDGGAIPLYTVDDGGEQYQNLVFFCPNPSTSPVCGQLTLTVCGQDLAPMNGFASVVIFSENPSNYNISTACGAGGGPLDSFNANGSQSNPTVDFTGSIFPLPNTILQQCVNGLLQKGNVCYGSCGSVEVALASIGQSGIIPPHTSGKLYRLTFDVTVHGQEQLEFIQSFVPPVPPDGGCTFGSCGNRTVGPQGIELVNGNAVTCGSSGCTGGFVPNTALNGTFSN
jgi:hypothetical protein